MARERRQPKHTTAAGPRGADLELTSTIKILSKIQHPFRQSVLFFGKQSQAWAIASVRCLGQLSDYMANTSLYPDLIPSYEHERLAALQPYQVLATPGQELFNVFVSVVAKLLDVPIALVSLVRATDVVFVGNEGLPEATVIDREDSMCSIAILQDGLTVFEDVATEPCALVNPFAAQQMNLGFYAGQALRAPSGLAIGSLCVLDRQPRQLSPAEGQLLQHLALVAQALLRLQAAHAANAAILPAVRNRLEISLQESLTRLSTLAELREWETSSDPAEAKRYTEARLNEARHLAQAMHRELQAALAEVK